MNFAKTFIPNTYRGSYERFTGLPQEAETLYHSEFPLVSGNVLVRRVSGTTFRNGTLATALYPLDLVDFRYNSDSFTRKCKILSLNYTRARFFPVVRTVSGDNYVSLSLGLFAVMFNKGKSFIRSKSVFMSAVGFLRKVLLFSSVREFLLIVQKTPQYLQETLAALNEPVVNVYKDPFGEVIINEKNLPQKFHFSMFLFKNNKPYGTVKVKQRGRLKRKIAKRIISMNRVLD